MSKFNTRHWQNTIISPALVLDRQGGFSRTQIAAVGFHYCRTSSVSGREMFRGPRKPATWTGRAAAWSAHHLAELHPQTLANDEGDGALPLNREKKASSIALLAIWPPHTTHQTKGYPSIEFLGCVGDSRKARGCSSSSCAPRKNAFRDASALPPGLVEDVWGNLVGVHESIL